MSDRRGSAPGRIRRAERDTSPLYFAARFDHAGGLSSIEGRRNSNVDRPWRHPGDVKGGATQALVEYTRASITSSCGGGRARDRSVRACARLRPAEARRCALTTGGERVRTYHDRQCAQSWSFRDAAGNELTAGLLRSIGSWCIFPAKSGVTVLPSSLTCFPAKVAVW